MKRLEDIARYVGHTRISIEIQEEDKEGCRNDPYSDFLDCYGNYYQEKAKDAEHAADTLVDVLLAALGYMIARGVSFVP
ncbi:hypothetical protein FACS189449_03290 [Alphaproteobacteria bacterium]|nr:hypothetical protein FACS189449_03290 [Alphaproteobacteria bacterium]